MATSSTKSANDPLITRINEDWGVLLGLVGRIDNREVREGALALCNDLHDRFAVCPASTRKEFVGCFPGGLLWHSLSVTKNLKEMRKAFGVEDEVSNDTLIVLGLFHDIGKLGNSKNDYYLPQTSNWHRDKGMLYEINPDLVSIPVNVRSVWWLNQYNIPLSEKEVAALMSIGNKGGSADQVSFIPSYKDDWETFLLQSAIRGTCIKHHGVHSLLDT